MKIRIILSLIAAVFNRFAPIGGGTTTQVPFSCVCFAPFHLNKDSDVFVSTPLKKGSVKILLTNDIYDSKEILSIPITASGLYKYKIPSTYIRSTNKITVKCTVKNIWLTSSEITMNVTRPRVKYVTENEEFVPAAKFKILDSDLTWSEESATYSFKNFEGIYVPSFYHKIDLNDFELGVTSFAKHAFTCNPSLVIKNVNGVFDDITGANTSAEFKLKAKQTSKGFTFELADDLYVDKETFLLSSTQKGGYVKTKHIYLPRNEMRVQDQYDAYFVFDSFGINFDLIYYQVELMALKNTFGDCINSEYCIQEEHV